MSMSEAMQAAQSAEELAAEREAALNIINTADTQHSDASSAADNNTQGDNQNGDNNQPQSLVESVQSLVSALNTSNQENTELRRSLAAVAAQATNDNPQTVIKKQLTVFGPGTTATHLFGIEHSLFDHTPLNRIRTVGIQITDILTFYLFKRTKLYLCHCIIHITHFRLQIHATFPDFPCLISLGYFGKECISH